MRITENPQKLFPTIYFFASNKPYDFVGDFITYRNFSDWTKLVSSLTKGITFILHDHMNSSYPLDLNTSITFDSKIDFVFRRSWYSNSEWNPKLFLGFNS